MAVSPARWPWRRLTVPPSLIPLLGPDERLLTAAACVDGTVLAASRFGLWVVRDAGPERLGWHLVSKARLTARVLTVTAAAVIGQLDDETQVLADLPVREFELADRSDLTDVVHARVRSSVAASRHLPWPGAGGWVVLRRVPGRDGLTRQVRLDPGGDAGVPGFAEAVAVVADELADVVTSG
jgi:hypothetical protein